MEGGRLYGGASDMLALLENSNNSLWVPSSSSTFHETMVNFDHKPLLGRRPSPKREFDGEDIGEEEFDINLFHQPEKKRRLTPEQVQFLEKSFEVDNKLEPERKVQLAKDLGLQPRQVAIWFQNRRARYKTKQLEKEYDSLKGNYDRLKVDYDSLYKEKENLQNEVKVLRNKLMQREGTDTGFDTPDYVLHLDKDIHKMDADNTEKMDVAVVPSSKQMVEEANSAKSDVFDSESSQFADGNHSPALEDHVDQQSDFSQDEEENLMMNKRLLLTPTPPAPLASYNNLLKVDDGGCYDPNANSCNFSLVDDQPVWSWLY